MQPNLPTITDWTQFWIQQAMILIGIIIAGFFAWKTWKSTQFNNQIYTDEILISARKEYRNIAIQFFDNPKLATMVKQCQEDVLNAYELACKLYLENALDKKSFKSLRKNEIIELFACRNYRNEPTYKRLHDKDNPYRSIETVYNEFKL